MELHSRRDTVRLGHRIAGLLEPGVLVLLSGDLGSGKTFLARAICRGLGVPATERVTSPTFALVHEYEVNRGILLHADLYRLLDAVDAGREVARLGLAEQRREGAMVLVEWGNDLGALLGSAYDLRVTLKRTDRVRSATLEGPLAEMLSTK
jgi:tRNA threonylcarbamoyladenosine biosynthesis protein TsaE